MTPNQLEELSKVFLIAGQNLPAVKKHFIGYKIRDGQDFNRERAVLNAISFAFGERAEAIRQEIMDSI